MVIIKSRECFFRELSILLFVAKQVRVLLDELQALGEPLAAIGREPERLKHRNSGWCHLVRFGCGVLHELHLRGPPGPLKLRVLLLGAFLIVEFLGVGEIGIVECVLDLCPDLPPGTEFMLLRLLGDLLLPKSVQHLLLHHRHLLHCCCVFDERCVCVPSLLCEDC